MDHRDDIQAETALALAYRCLLMVPHTSLSRHRVEPAMCVVREELSDLAGQSAEFIQNYYELHAQQAPRK